MNYSVVANPNGTPRLGRVVVAGQATEVAQAAAECRFAVSPSDVNVDALGRQVSIRVTAPDGCPWTARSDVPWIGKAVPTQGSGSATVQLAVAANSADVRAGSHL